MKTYSCFLVLLVCLIQLYYEAAGTKNKFNNQTAQKLSRGIGPQCPENKWVSNCTLPSGRNGICAQRCAVPSHREAELCCHVKWTNSIDVYYCCEELQNIGGRGAVGGKKTEPEEFPYMVALGWLDEENIYEYDYKCGGVLISSKFALTAAHCANVDGHEPIMVLPGGVNLVNNSALPHTIERVFEHPDYDGDFVYNDIALLLLFGNYTGETLDLWRRPYIANTNFTAIGYGDTTFGGTSSLDLLKVFLQHVTNENCQLFFDSEETMPNGILDTQLCAKDSNNIMDTCQGDSGGPLIMTVYNNAGNKKEYLMGITSFGQGCALSPPGVYTKVSAYLGWINNITRPWRQVTNRNNGNVYWN